MRKTMVALMTATLVAGLSVVAVPSAQSAGSVTVAGHRHALNGTSGGAARRPAGRPLLPDVGIRTLRQFEIARVGGRKMLKFPAVTPNVGSGPLEIRGTRASRSAKKWVGRQVVYYSKGGSRRLAASGARFYFAGDGHTHWHIRNFDRYQIFNARGNALRRGEKHGFCFEDNTEYRDWPGSPKHPRSPARPVYRHAASCGQARPNATRIVHGLSVGWGDTYPASLPDQGIDITGLPNGVYKVKVTADWQNFWRESNESNQSASARVRIRGNTVRLLSATNGL